ncbi:ureidoglycolate dehydrogenase [Sporomusa malonica]|uniref:Ureidoglycolate dehydrogenase (NAD+) n=1 Tax=Sporomusa malonica TaxID=112901 RepID=A0A1W2DQE7_9FIRM|nr:ureidoglycolate dehydrogenase [Sporomusa malonica]SMC99296.1 ureidoglycolate dehydrogenase (NAD+) [Sporomusa malonica]
MRISRAELKELMKRKFCRAGLKDDHADIVADVLVHADARGVHSHGAMRVEYYAERISKGGTNTNPNFTFTKTGPCSAVFEGDNAAGHVGAKLGMDEAIKMAKETGVAIVGVRSIGHSGALSYYVQQAAREKLIGISLCQSDPMAVPYGGAEPFYGTHPIALGAPGSDGRMITIDMATTIGAWGRILHARSKNEQIPDDWAVDENGVPTTDPYKVNALVHIAGAKGYGLAMMVDILSGVLLGLPYGNKVTSMYHDLSEGRNLGQLHIVIDPAYFTSAESFLQNITNTMNDINNLKPATGFAQVMYPGQSSASREEAYERDGIEIVDDIYNYLISDVIHNNAYDNKGAFAK